MTDEQPVEPSEVYRADGSRVPDRRPGRGTLPVAVRSLLPALIRSTTAGPLVAASALAVAAAVTARAAEVARQVVEQAAREAATRPTGPWIEVSVTRIEVRWPR
ncbi:hypothetical protein SAMN04488107_2006 [Geodermatophilus saharensis]|uniref:Uncharacterized protein n=1 Tax=Geodermatophilus saharensis TaxID=1137994 RepID=A0A239D5X2_9ACTN|nr:hypothetical protein [Geodermatophilus saharensis]SNS27542.1 hypothetical protein SAMN04488107_2006 [Geodermatophilus saharensis]